MGFFRGFYSSEREAKKSRQNLQKSKKEMDRIMREMRAKIDTIQVNITRINEEIIEKQSLADKFAKYEERTEQPNEKSRFQIQREAALQEIEKLQKQNYDLEAQMVPFKQSYERMSQTFNETFDRLDAMQRETTAKENEADIIKYTAKEEEKIQFELAEAEALLELRSEK
ncbi:hypothetical protein MKY30_23155 [Oceanobacillus sp. FSL W8-0428]|uniref:Uncharacterized protein n=1 Tax=Oceanobacillus sojae TaxID=582851 RepID=A0A511ZMQ5_9BACI|nr:hypothetical protein [Oceanobacillus sojae]GEN88732.1 hypothetical protein OSO01_34710 [Oceanobacillus sojae]